MEATNAHSHAYSLTYSLWGKEYDDLEAAKKVAEEGYSGLFWTPKFYGECVYHGDSMVGYNSFGHKICEIKFLENHKFCNHPNVDNCYYRKLSQKNFELEGD